MEVETGAGNTKKDIVLQHKERGCEPNLRDASPVVRDVGGRSYATQAVGRGGLRCRCQGNAESLGQVKKCGRARR